MQTKRNNDKDDLNKRAYKAGAFVIAEYGLSQFLRIAGNLVLTRLLFPELFGLMSLAGVFINGLRLFSDIGLAPGVIRSSRANDAAFLNTAWTLQVIRGLILCLLAAAIALPIAKIYEEPRMLYLVPIIGLNSLFLGFQSTYLITLKKNLKRGKLLYIEVGTKCVSLACMIVLAYVYKNIWSLVIGGLVASLLRTGWSHLLRPDIRNLFKYDKLAVKELLTFGKWIFAATAMMFLSTQIDKLLLGKLFPLAFLGIYNIAAVIAELPKMIIGRISHNVIYPLLAKYSHLPRHELRRKIAQKRKLLLYLLLLVVVGLIGFGDKVIQLLYDQRYEQAAWILPLLACGIWPRVLVATNSSGLLVIGKSQYGAIANFSKLIFMVVCVPLFYKLGGTFGAILAIVLNDIPAYIVGTYGLIREELSLLKQDAWATVWLIVGTCLLIAFRLAIGMGIPGENAFYS
jgi:O-antigen/teichoic acid export membrane protein